MWREMGWGRETAGTTSGKSEVILLGTAVQLRSAADITTIDIAGSPLPVALKLKSLVVI